MMSTDDEIRFHCAHCDYVTPVRDITPLAMHVKEKHPDEVFFCGSRTSVPSVIMEGLPDWWMKMPSGDRVCMHCGSMSEEDLFDIIEHFIAGDPGYKFSTTDKDYKVYASRPGVSNASEGGIKFYGDHCDLKHPDLKKRIDLFDQAVKISIERFQAMLDKLRDKFNTPATE